VDLPFRDDVPRPFPARCQTEPGDTRSLEPKDLPACRAIMAHMLAREPALRGPA
jgi:hypothetical protein